MPITFANTTAVQRFLPPPAPSIICKAADGGRASLESTINSYIRLGWDLGTRLAHYLMLGISGPSLRQAPPGQRFSNPAAYLFETRMRSAGPPNETATGGLTTGGPSG